MAPVTAQERDYNESKARSYNLPDPLRFANGKRITSRRGLGKAPHRAAAPLEENVYGRTPGAWKDTEFGTPRWTGTL